MTSRKKPPLADDGPADTGPADHPAPEHHCEPLSEPPPYKGDPRRHPPFHPLPDVPLALYAALARAQGEIAPLAHDSTRQADGGAFSYTSAERIIDAAREPLLSQGLLALRRGWEVQIQPHHPDQPPATALLHTTFRLVHGPSGEYEDHRCLSVARAYPGCPLDKAVHAALTVSLSYWLRDLLLIPRFHVQDEGETATPSPGRTAAISPGSKLFTAGLERISAMTAPDQLAAAAAKVQANTILNSTEKQTLLACIHSRLGELEAMQEPPGVAHDDQ